MNNKILITYASRTGSTAGVAQAIGQALIDAGAHVDVCSMSDVKNLDSYKAIVAGSAIQGGTWLPEAIQFIRKNQLTLSQKPFASFLVCMTLAMPKNDYRQHVATWMQPISALVKPVSEGLFAGVLDISKIPSISDKIKFRLSVIMGIWSEGDHRDWQAIRSWTMSIASLLS